MQPFTKHSGLAAPLDRVDVDTDQIIPKQFLKSIKRTGYDEGLFFDWRFKPDGSPNPDFVLNKPQYQGATILISGRNFGSGSSREHAPWALQQYGFRAVVAPSFGDIFRNNSFQNGLLPVTLPDERVAALRALLEAQPGSHLVVDLAAQHVIGPDGAIDRFDIDPFRKDCLLAGTDTISYTLGNREQIAA